MLFGEYEGMAPGWVIVVCVLVSALTAALVKLWPLMLQSRDQRAKAAREQVETEAKVNREQHETEARIKKEAYDAAMEGMSAVLRQYQADRANDAERITGLFTEIRSLQRNHAECLAKNEQQNSLIMTLQARVESIEVSQDLARVPTRAEAIIVAGEDRRVIEWNQAATMLFHWTAEEAKGMDVAALVPQRYLAAHDEGYADCLAGHKMPRRGPYHLEARTKEGEEIPVRMTLTGWEEPDGSRRFAASITRTVRVQGKDPTQVNAATLRAPRAPASPHAEAVAAQQARTVAEQAAAVMPIDPASAIKAAPRPGGGTIVSAPPGAEVTVKENSIKVEVTDHKGGPPGPAPST